MQSRREQYLRLCSFAALRERLLVGPAVDGNVLAYDDAANFA